MAKKKKAAVPKKAAKKKPAKGVIEIDLKALEEALTTAVREAVKEAVLDALKAAAQDKPKTLKKAVRRGGGAEDNGERNIEDLVIDIIKRDGARTDDGECLGPTLIRCALPNHRAAELPPLMKSLPTTNLKRGKNNPNLICVVR